MEKAPPSKTIRILTVSLAISVIAVCLLIIFSFLMFLERNASNKLLDKLSLARPGIKLADIREQLGSPMYEKSKLEEMIDYGPIKDEQFCKGKILNSFYAGTPPCRAIDVYTDVNNIIIYSTWHGL